jgi:hypothetical protein
MMLWENPMFKELSQRERYGLVAVFAVAVAAAFALGFAASGSATPTGAATADSSDSVSPSEIRQKVTGFVDAVSRGEQEITVQSVERSANFSSFYEVTLATEVDIMNQTMTREITTLVSEDGQYIFTSQPMDLDNPPEPQPRQAPRQPPQPTG